MDFSYFIDLFLHLDKHLANVLETYHYWTYVIVFVIIFIETGLVVTPFLPGDSLIFAVAAIIASTGKLDPILMLVILYIAAILGDSLNYEIGKLLGKKVINHEKIRFIKPEHIEETQKFFDKYGAKTITIARFVPIVRTFAPFVAGVGKMPYKTFVSYNVLGGILWISSMFGAGYYFGGIPFVKENFEIIVLGIIFISVIPAIIPFVKSKLSKTKSK